MTESDDVRGVPRRAFLQLGGAAAVAGVAGAALGAVVTGTQAEAAAPRHRSDLEPTFRQFADSPPFSFTYGGRASADLLPSWRRDIGKAHHGPGRTTRHITWTDPQTGLRVRAEVVVYPDAETTEWTVHFRNTGSATSPALSDVLGVDTVISTHASVATLHRFNGSADLADDYAPSDVALSAGTPALLYPNGGRPSNGTWPYFNVDWGSGRRGVMVAVGWPGQWCAQLDHDGDAALRLRAGMTSLDPSVQAYTDIMDAELLDTTLEPGEHVRTPLIVLMRWQAPSWTLAQNSWRRWMAAYNLPRFGGKRPEPIIPTTGSLSLAPDQQQEFAAIDACVSERTTRDRGGFYTHWWVDAGWYAFSDTPDPDWSSSVGNWYPDPTRFPNGMDPTFRRAQQHDLKSLLWSEPERVRPHTYLADRHRDWLIGLPGVAADDQTYLLDFGNPDAYAWAVQHFDWIIRHQGGPGGLDVFRQDFNMDPLAYWNAADSPGRSGMTQQKHVIGHLDFWDELSRRHPAMWIDSCASGGRRNDLESMRRAVPLLRSDYQFEPTGNQSQTYGIALWLPYYGTGVGPQSAHDGDWGSELYVCRSSLAPCYASSLDADTATDEQWDVLRRMNEDFLKIKDELIYSDFYPLTQFSLDDDVWMVLQFHRPQDGTGAVLAFRRPDAPAATRDFALHGLQPRATYAVKSLDGLATQRMTGRALAGHGLRIDIPTAPDARLFRYRQVRR